MRPSPAKGEDVSRRSPRPRTRFSKVSAIAGFRYSPTGRSFTACTRRPSRVGDGGGGAKADCSACSGVLFTADPVTGNPPRIVIEAAYGLGVALVSGQLSPDRIVLSRPGLQVIERQLGNKSAEFGGGQAAIRRASTAGRRRGGQAALLDSPTTSAAGHFWPADRAGLGRSPGPGMGDGRRAAFVLQSRPITTLRRKTGQPRGVWSSMNSWEVLPGVATPMSWSVLNFYIQHAFGPQFKLFGVDLERQPLFDRIAGRAYANMNTYARMLAAVPGPSPVDLVAVLGGHHGKILAGELLSREPGWPEQFRRVARLPRLAAWFAVHAVARHGSDGTGRFPPRDGQAGPAPTWPRCRKRNC